MAIETAHPLLIYPGQILIRTYSRKLREVTMANGKDPLNTGL
jgi:hypothetical protein